MLGGLYLMHNGVMPPFAGTDAERDALAAYLAALQPPSPHAYLGALQPPPPPASGPPGGKAVFEQNCSMCHRAVPADHLFNLPRDPQAAAAALQDLPGLFPVMPDLKLSDPERQALVQWINAERAALGVTAPANGGN